MSQEKVDRNKLAKKNRERDKKRAKVKKVLLIFLFAMILGALIGIPLGRWIYNYKTTHVKEEDVFISANDYEDWFNQYWVDNYSDLVTGASLATEADTGNTTADTTSDTEAASGDTEAGTTEAASTEATSTEAASTEAASTEADTQSGNDTNAVQ